LDQRGTGRFEPSLACAELQSETAENVALADAERLRIDQLTRCRDRLVGKGIDLAAYTTAQNAADVDDLRAAFGYDTVDLLGVSYGTRLALDVMRDFLRAIASVVLDSTLPNQVDAYTQLTVGFDRSLHLLFSSCAADDACNRAFSTLAADFSRVVAQLDADPVSVTVTNPRTDKPLTYLVNGWRFVSAMQGGLYSASRLRYLPMLIAQLKAGDTNPAGVFPAAVARGRRVVQLRDGVLGGVQRPAALRDAGRDERGGADRPAGVARGVPARRTGRVRGLRAMADEAREPDRAPAGGERHPHPDSVERERPRDPPAFNELAAATLSRSFLFAVPGIVHSILGNGGACGATIIGRFFAAPAVRPNTDCASAFGITYVTTGKIYAEAPPMTINPAKQYTATIVTNKGTMAVQLFADVAPRAVNNFAFLADDHFYDGVAFWRVLPGLLVHNLAQIIEVAGEAIHAVHDDRIPLAREAQQGIELGPRDILARCFVGEGAVHRNLFELAVRVLVEGADPDIADALSIHTISSICQDRVYDVREHLSRKRNNNPRLTRRRECA